jgi:AbrB family looped-hinge helix DNA binding protein
MKEKLTHFLASTKVGPKGQIVIPKEIREMFSIQSGDSLLIMADAERGIAIQKQSVMEDVAKAIFEGKAGSVLPKEDPEELAHFAAAIKGAANNGGKSE